MAITIASLPILSFYFNIQSVDSSIYGAVVGDRLVPYCQRVSYLHLQSVCMAGESILTCNQVETQMSQDIPDSFILRGSF